MKVTITIDVRPNHALKGDYDDATEAVAAVTSWLNDNTDVGLQTGDGEANPIHEFFILSDEVRVEPVTA